VRLTLICGILKAASSRLPRDPEGAHA